jgi:serine/threonine protein phosphatase PrpC
VDATSIALLVEPEDIAASCQRLIQAARDAGGADNITCLLLRYNSEEASPLPDDRPLSESPSDPTDDIPSRIE